MSITTVGNHLIHYEVLGRGEPLIFVHGWLGSWRYWWSSMQALSTKHRAFAFDLWGFGDSSKETDQYSVRSYVTMIDQFINQLGIMKPVTLIGHGMGAAAAYAPQTQGNIVVASGSIRIKLGASILRLEQGDAALFEADVEQIYENPNDDLAVLYLVVTYAALPEG